VSNKNTKYSSTKIDMSVIEEYQKILSADPSSKVFAVLADAYREMGILEQADNIARRGVSKHPNYAPGYVTWARILMKKNDLEGAIQLLQKATELSADNLLAHQVLGEAYLLSKKPKEALKAHKMALFLNPQNERSKQVVKKLESLAAEDFSEDVFAMKPLHNFTQEVKKNESKQELKRDIEASLSLVDALIVRHDPVQARALLLRLQKSHPENIHIVERLKLLDHEAETEKADSLNPLPYREKMALELKIKKLRTVLKAIDSFRN